MIKNEFRRQKRLSAGSLMAAGSKLDFKDLYNRQERRTSKGKSYCALCKLILVVVIVRPDNFVYLICCFEY